MQPSEPTEQFVASKRINDMKYNLNWLIEKYEKGEELKYVFFWGHRKSKNNSITQSCLSQWWGSPFLVNEILYKTAEHWMMSQKALLFEDTISFQKIISSETPAEAKSMGRQVCNFNEDIWISKRAEIVVQGTLHKFSQNEELRQFLINTKDNILVEASPVDTIWGIGMAADNEKIENPNCWKGLNLLGFALMEVRDYFQQ